MEENGKRRKKGRSFLENLAKDNGEVDFPICWMKNNFFFPARHNKKVKTVKIGETIFHDFLS